MLKKREKAELMIAELHDAMGKDDKEAEKLKAELLAAVKSTEQPETAKALRDLLAAVNSRLATDDSVRQAIRDTRAMLEAAGGIDIQTDDPDTAEPAPPGIGIHEMGTARMGRDPRDSVLNGYCQAHDVPNLFVTDGACMASTAVQNPSITYMALTARAVDYAVRTNP